MKEPVDVFSYHCYNGISERLEMVMPHGHYLDVIRNINEMGTISKISHGVIFHNTLASSDYGYFQHGTFEPRPNYFGVLLWNKLMGINVYDTGEVSEGAHIFANSRADGQEGFCYCIINNSTTESTCVVLPKAAKQYTLSGKDGNLRATVMTLNGMPLVLGENDELPAMEGIDAF